MTVSIINLFNKYFLNTCHVPDQNRLLAMAVLKTYISCLNSRVKRTTMNRYDILDGNK